VVAEIIALRDRFGVRDFQVERQLSIVQRKDARLPAPAAAFLSLLYQPRLETGL